MPSAHLVEANGAFIPAIGLGTFGLTGDSCAQAVQWALEAGYRHIDTAKMYDNEEAVGAGLKAGGVARDEVFVTTKVWWEDIGSGALQRSTEGSLKRLGLSQVDLLLIHWPNPSVPLAQSTAALCEARKSGLARNVGVSNYPVAMLTEALGLASEPLVANQVEYHPYLGQRPLYEACRANGVAMTSYCPLGRSNVLADPTVAAIADGHGRSPSQIVLRWHVQQPGVVAIPKSGTKAHIAANLAVFDFELSAEEMSRIAALARPDGRVVNPPFSPHWDAAA